MTITVTIDGMVVEATLGESLLDVARRNGVGVPSLCHHRFLRPYGACRVCLVEVTKDNATQITTSCNYPAVAGLFVRTNTEEVVSTRRLAIELLLALAPNVESMKRFARANGVDSTRFTDNSTNASDGLENCIMCAKCTRVCQEVVGACAISLQGRGDRKKVGVPFGQRVSPDCIGCGACSDVCPTNAISMEDRKIAVLRQNPGQRPCRYTLMGLTSGALCPNNYDCAICEVDQGFVAQWAPHHPIFAARKKRDSND